MATERNIRRAIEYMAPRTVLDGKNVDEQINANDSVKLEAGTKVSLTVFLDHGTKHTRTTLQTDHEVELTKVYPTPYDANQATFELSSPERRQAADERDEVYEDAEAMMLIEEVFPGENDVSVLGEYAGASEAEQHLERELVTEFLLSEPDIATRFDALSVKRVVFRTGITKDFPADE
jgi:hypothetical protein